MKHHVRYVHVSTLRSSEYANSVIGVCGWCSLFVMVEVLALVLVLVSLVVVVVVSVSAVLALVFGAVVVLVV